MFNILLYVDDLIFTGDFGVEEFKSVIKDEFETTDLGIMRQFLWTKPKINEFRQYPISKMDELRRIKISWISSLSQVNYNYEGNP